MSRWVQWQVWAMELPSELSWLEPALEPALERQLGKVPEWPNWQRWMQLWVLALVSPPRP